MLRSFVLKIAPETDCLLPPHVGRANYAQTLASMGRYDGTLVEAIHARNGPKPLTCSGLLSGGQRTAQGVALRASEPCTVRITGLNRPTVECLLAAFVVEKPELWPLKDVQRQEVNFRVVGVVTDAALDAWAGAAIYEQLAAPLYSTQPPAHHIILEFASPTSFRSKELNVALPMPGLVFGSLADRWNTFSGTLLSSEFRRFAEEQVVVSRFTVESRSVEQKGSSLDVGCVGRATYAAKGGDHYWRAALAILADFALYSGVGVNTATGMGQVRRVQ